MLSFNLTTTKIRELCAGGQVSRIWLVQLPGLLDVLVK